MSFQSSGLFRLSGRSAGGVPDSGAAQPPSGCGDAGGWPPRYSTFWAPEDGAGGAGGGDAWSLLAGICVTACAIRRMARSGGRRRTMVLACVWHIAVLVGFKYTEFLTGGAVEVGWAPLGLSFFTFQQLWLLKEVYTGGISVPAPGDSLLLYGLFFPTVTSGPILRPGDLFPQLREGDSSIRTGRTPRRVSYAICCGTIEKGAAGGRLRRCGEQRLGTSGQSSALRRPGW